jgi:asparagine N-glycosylation enzyme membrane subunit Stt3
MVAFLLVIIVVVLIAAAVAIGFAVGEHRGMALGAETAHYTAEAYLDYERELNDLDRRAALLMVKAAERRQAGRPKELP